MINYYRYLGKSTGHLLVYHSLDVGAFVMAYGERCPAFIERVCQPSDIQLQHLSALAALHDLGKFAPSFQGLNLEHYAKAFGSSAPPPPYTNEVRHYRVGRAVAKSVLPSGVQIGSQTLNAIFLHHGIPVTYDAALATLSFSSEVIEDSKAFVTDVFDLIGVKPPFTCRLDPRKTWALAGFIVFCDWLASGHAPSKTEEVPLSQYWHDALSFARSVIESLGLSPQTASREEGMEYLFPKIKSPTPLQKTVARLPLGNGPQLFIIEEPTGAGKTEAGTVLAHRIMKNTDGKRIYYGLPTMATSNSLYRRLADAYDKLFERAVSKPSLILAHATSRMSADFRQSLNWKPDSDWNAACAIWLADDRRKCLLADVGVGTIDQALMGAMPKRFQSLRLFGLAGNVLIVDEVHAYDTFTFGLVCALLTFHSAMGGSAILLSATLPSIMRQQLVDAFWMGILSTPGPKISAQDYPLLTYLNPLDQKNVLHEFPGKPPSSGRDVGIRFFHDKLEIEEFLLETAASGKCACWIVNTIDDAINAHDRLAALAGETGKDVNVILFHSRFALRDRQRIEGEVELYFGEKSTPTLRANKILVATQVVEQSLDLDFDELVIDLCPIDLVIQRMGRLRRHIRDTHGNKLDPGAFDQRGNPTLAVHSPPIVASPKKDWFSSSFKGAAGVYPDHGRLWKTASILQERKVIRIPLDVRTLIEEVYDIDLAESLPDGIKKLTLDAEGEALAKRGISSQAVLTCHSGYSYDALRGGVWDWNDTPPTRMGKGSRVDVYLSVFDGLKVSPLYPDGEWPWEMSRVQISVAKVSYWMKVDNPTRISNDIYESARDLLPGKGIGALLLIVSPDDRGGYECRLPAGEGHQAILKYSSIFGARVAKEKT